MTAAPEAAIDLFWLPLGAGGHSVRWNGRAYEVLAALAGRRRACALYHSALEVRVPEGRYVIEMTPVPRPDGVDRGVVASGAVGSCWAGRLRLFRYELRSWRGGVISDVREAGTPLRVSHDPATARRALELVASVPTPTWGRDESGTGEMWNSNSVTAWLLAASGLHAAAIRPPAGGRAPGWHAGLVVAARGAPHSSMPCRIVDTASDGAAAGAGSESARPRRVPSPQGPELPLRARTAREE